MGGSVGGVALGAEELELAQAKVLNTATARLGLLKFEFFELDQLLFVFKHHCVPFFFQIAGLSVQFGLTFL